VKSIAFSRRNQVTIVIVVVLALGISIGYALDQRRTLYHFMPVDPGKLYRSGTLSRRGLEKVHSITRIKTIINLRSEAELNAGSWYQMEREFALEKGINLVNIPLFYDSPPNRDQVKEFMDVVRNPEMLPALVHCEMGVIRTGMLVSVYKITVLGEPNRKVFEELPMFGHSSNKSPAFQEFILSFAPN
jgi:protein tyrosine/serine phosphatase